MLSKIIYWKTWGLIISFPLSICALGQPIKDNMAQFKDWPRFNEIEKFYESNGFQFAWTSKTQSQFLGICHTSATYGLSQDEYDGNLLKGQSASQSPDHLDDPIETDIRFTDAAIHFFSDLQVGKSPYFGYAGLKYVPDASGILLSLKSHLQSQNLNSLVEEVQPTSKEYQATFLKLNWFQHIAGEAGFKEDKIISTKVDNSNIPLLKRLYQLGITDSIEYSISNKDLAQKLKIVQRQFDVLSDGVLRSTSLQAMNVPLIKRIEELKKTLNYLRWLDQAKKNSVLILNIAATTFFVYENSEIILDSKVIVGKPSTPTPTLTSTITQVILYPYWMVPNQIATHELLPSIKKNVGFLEAGNFQVLNKQGKVINPYDVDWHSLSGSNFPYTIRQSTGCDNALGILKFEFYNPFTVYLHDTPTKVLFSFSKRYFSHGCMRIEKPIELAHVVLGANSKIIDAAAAKGCINQKAPKPISVERKLPVIILYTTAWYNKDGEVIFYDDVYHKN